MDFDVCRPVRDNMGVSIFHSGHLGGELGALRCSIGITFIQGICIYVGEHHGT